MTWLLIITVVSGGAMGGPIKYDSIPYPTQQACEQAIKSVRVQQTTQLAGNNVTHTTLIFCKPKP